MGLYGLVGWLFAQCRRQARSGGGESHYDAGFGGEESRCDAGFGGAGSGGGDAGFVSVEEKERNK